MCSEFDEETWKCMGCSNGTQIDSTGIICVSVQDHCLSYSLENGKCTYCEEGYLLDVNYDCVYVSELADQVFFTADSTPVSSALLASSPILTSTNTLTY